SLAGLIEVQVTADDHVEEVLVRQALELLGLEVVGRNQEFRPAARCEEGGRIGVVPAVREELQREVGVGRAALAKVDLDGVWLPLPIAVPHHDEIESESTEHPFAGEPLADLPRLIGYLDRIGRIRGGPASQIAL